MAQRAADWHDGRRPGRRRSGRVLGRWRSERSAVRRPLRRRRRARTRGCGRCTSAASHPYCSMWGHSIRRIRTAVSDRAPGGENPVRTERCSLTRPPGRRRPAWQQVSSPSHPAAAEQPTRWPAPHDDLAGRERGLSPQLVPRFAHPIIAEERRASPRRRRRPLFDESDQLTSLLGCRTSNSTVHFGIQ